MIRIAAILLLSCSVALADNITSVWSGMIVTSGTQLTTIYSSSGGPTTYLPDFYFSMEGGTNGQLIDTNTYLPNQTYTRRTALPGTWLARMAYTNQGTAFNVLSPTNMWVTNYSMPAWYPIGMDGITLTSRGTNAWSKNNLTGPEMLQYQFSVAASNTTVMFNAFFPADGLSALGQYDLTTLLAAPTSDSAVVQVWDSSPPQFMMEGTANGTVFSSGPTYDTNKYYTVVVQYNRSGTNYVKIFDPVTKAQVGTNMWLLATNSYAFYLQIGRGDFHNIYHDWNALYSNFMISTNPTCPWPQPDFTPVAPVISSIATAPSGTNCSVTWNTDELADSTVNYGATSGYGSTTNTDNLFSTTTTNHNVTLSGLTPSATYHFQVASTAYGLSSSSADDTFTMPSVPTTPPGVAKTNVASAGVSITGLTNSVAVVAGDNRVMVVNVGWYGFTQNVASLTYSGSALTQAFRTNFYNASSGGWATQYYLVAPSTGTNDLALVMSSPTTYLAMTALVLTNCAQTGTIGTGTGNFTATARQGVTNTVSALTTDMVVNNDTVAAVTARVFTPGPGQTMAAIAANGNNTSVLMSYQVGAGGIMSESFTNTVAAEAQTLISVPYHGL